MTDLENDECVVTGSIMLYSLPSHCFVHVAFLVKMKGGSAMNVTK